MKITTSNSPPQQPTKTTVVASGSGANETKGGGGGDDDDEWLLRPYDDFLQQSLESGSFINYKPVKNNNKKKTTSNNPESNESTATTTATTSIAGQQLLLIKYKNKPNDSLEGGGDSSSTCGRNAGGGGVGLHKRREIHSLLFFLFFLFVTIITLSQIIVMHSQTSQSSFYQIKLMQEELKLMDASIDRMLKEKHVLPVQVWYALKNYDNNLKKFSRIIDDYYSPLNYIAPELQLDSAPNVSSSSSSNSHDSSSPQTIAASFVTDLKQTCSSSSSYVDQHIYAQTLAYLSDFSNPNNNKNEDLTDNRLVTDLDSLRSLLNMSLAIAGTTNPNSTTSTNNNNPRQKCLRVLLDALYFIFSQQYSKLFKAVGFRFDSNARLVNETILDLIENARSNEQPNDSVMLMPALRDMRVFFDKYRRSISSGGKNSELRFCDPLPPYLYGPLNITEKRANQTSMRSIELENENVQMGGYWSPKSCRARHKIAIIIPYRDREDHLVTLLSYLHPILQRQQLEYRIYVTEQWGNGTFNKAIIMNAAFINAFDQDNYNCYCFHDVDLVPEDDRNMYSCSPNPKHMSIGVDEMNYKLQYEELIGGVLIMKTEHVIAANGYSNLYWGWGAEDDDLYYRLKGLGYKIERPPPKIGRYKMMKHEKRKPQLWSKRAKLLYSSVNRMTWDGISSAKYTLINITEHKLFTHLLIDVGTPPAGFS